LEEVVVSTPQAVADPVFDRCWWIYSVCRERLFADHTETIAAALAARLGSRPGMQLMEVGCGPGFYSRKLAALFPLVQILGVDTSERLLSHARLQARRDNLDNCRFMRADARSLTECLQEADAAITSRLFLVLAEPASVVQAIHQTLRPGGVFFAAEPTSPLRAAVPLWLMRGFELMRGRWRTSEWPVRCRVMEHDRFKTLISDQPWVKVEIWRDKRYQYALCEKAS
jgi:arsenite methyltransferase